jgi:hypothetical protein
MASYLRGFEKHYRYCVGIPTSIFDAATLVGTLYMLVFYTPLETHLRITCAHLSIELLHETPPDILRGGIAALRISQMNIKGMLEAVHSLY